MLRALFRLFGAFQRCSQAADSQQCWKTPDKWLRRFPGTHERNGVP